MIDQEGINSLNTGAEPITYEGTEGPKSPEQDQAMAAGIPEGLTVQEAIETFKASEGRDPNNIEEVIKYFKNRTLSEAFPTEEYQIEFERVFPEMIPLRGTDEYNEDLENYFRGLAKGPIFPSPTIKYFISGFFSELLALSFLNKSVINLNMMLII